MEHARRDRKGLPVTIDTPDESLPGKNMLSQSLELPARPRLARMYRMQYEPVQTAWVLLYPEGMVQLNGSAAEILRRCNGQLSVGDIVIELETLFTVQGLEPQVRNLLKEGMRRGWII